MRTNIINPRPENITDGDWELIKKANDAPPQDWSFVGRSAEQAETETAKRILKDLSLALYRHEEYLCDSL